LQIYSGQIIEMAREISKCVEKAHKIEKELNLVLDRSQAKAWIQDLSDIIGRYIQDSEILTMVAEDMNESLSSYIKET
jgi:hypothetical protein